MKQVFFATVIWVFAGMMALAAGPQGFAIHTTPQAVSNIKFVNEDGTEMTLKDFHGRVILLNVWATWCPPCVKEMPTLDALQKELGGSKFEVVALSIDSAGPNVVRRFFNKIGIEHLNMYVDETMRSASKLRAFGLPTTILINADGKELGRLIGPAIWDTPEMIAFFRGYLGNTNPTIE
jgi:thiol-disulfide isomerase/thioredoxin